MDRLPAFMDSVTFSQALPGIAAAAFGLAVIVSLQSLLAWLGVQLKRAEAAGDAAAAAQLRRRIEVAQPR